MDMTQPPPPSTKKKRKGKKRKQPSKKSPSDSDGRSSTTPPNCVQTNGKANNNPSSVKFRSGDYPYPTDYNDHFETPARAYDDIFPLLKFCMSAKKKNHGNKGKTAIERKKSEGQSGEKETTVYDPYYCTGRAAIHLEDVFRRNGGEKMTSMVRIQHQKRDFYRDVRQKSVPDHDVLVTNPPYSGDHKERCLQFAAKQLKERGRPFFLLMPNYVATKEYFRKIVLDANGDGSSTFGRIQTFYVAPPSDRSYEYEHPEGTGHRASPFASVWFCGLRCGGDSKSVTDAFVKFHSSRASPLTGIPRITTSLRDLIRVGGVSGEKRKNPRQRKKMRQQAMQRKNDTAMSGASAAGSGRDGPRDAKGSNNERGNHGIPHTREESKRHKKKRRFN